MSHSLPSCDCLPPQPAHPSGTHQDSTWYGIPCSVWPGGVSPPGCVPSCCLVKINPVLAEPRRAKKDEEVTIYCRSLRRKEIFFGEDSGLRNSSEESEG